MEKDLRSRSGMCNSIEKVYLVDEQKRITSPYFNVWIPSLMDGIEQGVDDSDNDMDLSEVLLNNETGLIQTNVKTSGCILAKSIHPYRFKHEGWIPEFKVETITYEKTEHPTGSASEISSASTDGQTERTDHDHAIKKAFKMITNKLKSFVFEKSTSTNMVVTNSTEVDYQELNRIYIKKGHALYGSFVNGSDGEFVILAIDNVVPYYDENEDNGSNQSMPTTDPN